MRMRDARSTSTSCRRESGPEPREVSRLYDWLSRFDLPLSRLAVVFEAPRRLAVREEPISGPASGEVRVRTAVR